MDWSYPWIVGGGCSHWLHVYGSQYHKQTPAWCNYTKLLNKSLLLDLVWPMTVFDPTSCTNTVWCSYTMRCCTCLLMTSAPEFASFKMTSFCVYFQIAILPQIKIKNIHLFSIERIQTHNRNSSAWPFIKRSHVSACKKVWPISRFTWIVDQKRLHTQLTTLEILHCTYGWHPYRSLGIQLHDLFGWIEASQIGGRPFSDNSPCKVSVIRSSFNFAAYCGYIKHCRRRI